MTHKRIITALFVLALLGFALSIYSLLHNQGFASGEFCTIGEKLNCDVVNKGPFSQIMGVPVALIGVIGYLFLAVASGLKLKQPLDKSLTKFLTIASIGGFLFALYLSYIEAFILTTWCLLCLTSQAIILVMAILSILLTQKEKHV
ncbi:MAG: vitamin K epoxide reductase family protein [Patescibacteria group bacterium]